jgi:hypothetical protein
MFYFPNEQTLQLTNFVELFSSKMTWMIDDRWTYQVKFYKRLEGKDVTTPVNRVVNLANPKINLLF